jgi:hypothetical protein
MTDIRKCPFKLQIIIDTKNLNEEMPKLEESYVPMIYNDRKDE